MGQETGGQDADLDNAGVREPNGSTGAPLVVRLMTGLYFVVTTTLLGLLVGGFFGKVFGSKSAMGWDQLADFLGGVMLGGVIALAVSSVVVGRLQPRRRMIVGTAFLLMIVAVIVALRVALPAQ